MSLSSKWHATVQHWQLILGTLTLACCLSFVFKLLRWYSYKQNTLQTLQGVSIPPRHWLLGHLSDLDPCKVLPAIRDWMRSVDSKAFQLWFGPGYLISLHLHHHHTLQPVLNTAEPKSDLYDFMKPWIGEGLIVSKGRRWARDRRLLSPAFHFDTLKPYVAIFNSSVNNMRCKWEELLKTSGGSIELEMFETISTMTLDSLLKCTFGVDNHTDKQETEKYLDCVKRMTEAAIKRILQPLLYYDIIYHMTPVGRQWRKDCDFVHQYSAKVIKERRDMLHQNSQVDDLNDNFHEKKHLDFLDMLLNARDEEGEGMSDKEIQEQVDTFMFAGHDTTASALSFCIYNLARHPEHQKKCKDEICGVLLGRDNITWDDLWKLPYLTMCVKESLRLHPPVPGINRQLTKPMDIDGKTIGPDTWISLSVYGVHHNPSIWNDPEKYDPLRFHPESSKDRPPHAYIPFSAGPRNCIGKHFALNELKVALALILHHFHLETVSSKPVTPTPLIVMRAKDGVWIKITKA